MDVAEDDLIKLIAWLLAVTEHAVSPDAYSKMLQVTNSCVLHVFQRSTQPHEAELVDLATAVSIICPRRRPEARFGLHFLREALIFREEHYAQPIIISGPIPTLKILLDNIAEGARRYSARYMPPDRGLYNDYEAYYSNLTYQELMADAQGLPNAIALNRAAALFKRLAELACEDKAVSPDDRYRAASLSGVVEDQIRTTQSPEVVQRFESAARASLDNLVAQAIFPELAERISSGEFSKVRSGNKPA